ncbi:hypothetical protein AB0D35_03155 [Streptomyces sp. NPDC048301]|uniref:hypothetical protein n=1 Tax=Streptomyces sp. NPDC048301 TaxID=3155631 RepID=UPI003427C313
MVVPRCGRTSRSWTDAHVIETGANMIGTLGLGEKIVIAVAAVTAIGLIAVAIRRLGTPKR